MSTVFEVVLLWVFLVGLATAIWVHGYVRGVAKGARENLDQMTSMLSDRGWNPREILTFLKALETHVNESERTESSADPH